MEIRSKKIVGFLVLHLILVYSAECSEDNYIIRQINFDGNTSVSSNILLKYLSFRKGDTLSRSDILSSTNDLCFNRLLKQASCEITTTNHYADLSYAVTEQRLYNTFVGAGVSPFEGFLVFADLSFRNLSTTKFPPYGDGQEIKAVGIIGGESHHLKLSLIEPCFFNPDQQLAYTVYQDDKRYLDSGYDQNDKGFNAYFRKYYHPYTSVKIGYAINETKLYNLHNVSHVIQREEGNTVQGGVYAEWTYDSRDQSFMTSVGDVCSVRGNVINHNVGGDVDYYSVDASCSSFLPIWFGHVLSSYASMSIAESYGVSDYVPVFDKTYIGGFGTVRGYDYRSIGPKDEYGNPIGGRLAVVASIQYMFTFYPKISPILFFDTGQNNEDFDVCGDEWQSSYGIGIRAKLWKFPASCDLAIPLDETTNKKPKIEFQIGYVF